MTETNKTMHERVTALLNNGPEWFAPAYEIAKEVDAINRRVVILEQMVAAHETAIADGDLETQAQDDGARPSRVTPRGYTQLPAALIHELAPNGGFVWFLRHGSGRWCAWHESELNVLLAEETKANVAKQEAAQPEPASVCDPRTAAITSVVDALNAEWSAAVAKERAGVVAFLNACAEDCDRAGSALFTSRDEAIAIGCKAAARELRMRACDIERGAHLGTREVERG